MSGLRLRPIKLMLPLLHSNASTMMSMLALSPSESHH